jgi:proline iminopeptidase
MTTGHGRVRTDDGALLWTASDGRHGIPVVLCHGGPGLWDYLGPAARMLDDVAQVVRWDQRGCGRSARAGPYSMARFVRDLEALRRHFGHERWLVGGHSWGARLALEYALAFPSRTLGVLYVSGTGVGHEWRSAYHEERDGRLGPAGRRRRDELARRARSPDEEREWRTLSFAPDVGHKARAAEVIADLVGAPYPINLACNVALEHEQKRTAPEQVLARCHQLHEPVCVVHGDRDPRPVAAVADLAAALSSARLEVLPGVGHFPWLEDADTFAQLAREFIATVAR